MSIISNKLYRFWYILRVVVNAFPFFSDLNGYTRVILTEIYISNKIVYKKIYYTLNFIYSCTSLGENVSRETRTQPLTANSTCNLDPPGWC